MADRPKRPSISFRDIKTAVRNDLKTGYLGKNPSVLGNIILGEPWNANTRWGQPKKYEQKPFKLPSGDTWKPKTSPTPTPRVDFKAIRNEAPSSLNISQATKSGGLKFKPTISQVLGTQITSTPTPTSMPTPTPTPDPRKNWRNFADMVIREGNAKGYHGETLARQKALESAYGESSYAKERYNYGGIGAYDSNPDNAWDFASPEDYLQAYFDLIEKDQRYKEAYANRAFPKKYLNSLKKAGYASDPDYVWKIMNTPVYKD